MTMATTPSPMRNGTFVSIRDLGNSVAPDRVKPGTATAAAGNFVKAEFEGHHAGISCPPGAAA